MSGGGNYRDGESVVLKATANKGFAFAGWYDEEAGEPVEAMADYHLANFSYIPRRYRQSIVAKFVPISGTITLKAATEKGQVFAGWYTNSHLESPYVASDGTDYRTASCTYSVPLYSTLFPRVVTEAEDRNIYLECEPFDSYDSNKQMSLLVKAISCSLPTVTAANLPTGLKFDAK